MTATPQPAQQIIAPTARSGRRIRRRGWTRLEYERLTEMGFWGPEEKLELIEGEIVHKMPQNSPHATGITLVADALRPLVPVNHHLRIQLPLAISDRSEPEPDIALVSGTARNYSNAHPTDALLVVEVADSSLSIDRTTKATIYAQAQVAEYWILNLNDRQLEVYREPGQVRRNRVAYVYQTTTWYDASQNIAPLFAPASPVLVRDLLP